jgi:hypothetical protein
MPPRKRTQSGAGALDTLKSIGNFIKTQKLLSTGLGFIPHPAAQTASAIAAQLGLGRKKKAPKKKKQSGRGIFSDLGGGIGNVFGGLGNGLGSFSHGLFGGARKKKVLKL